MADRHSTGIQSKALAPAQKHFSMPNYIRLCQLSICSTEKSTLVKKKNIYQCEYFTMVTVF